MKSVLKEPLVHFLLAGVLLFGVNAWWQSRANVADKTIYVSKADMERLAALFVAETNRPPAPEDMQAMVADHVRQKVLVREARRLGLGEGDTVVDRRLAQKMAFMISDLAEPGTPDDAELSAWYEANAEKFLEPATLTFQHVFLAEGSARDPASVLDKLSTDDTTEWIALSDPFMLQNTYSALSERDAARLFGRGFSNAVFALEPSGTWQGPVASAFGAHLVRITAKSAPRRPPFSEVKKDVLIDWQNAQRRAANTDAVAELIRSYNVIVEGVTN